jgi:hypothetical protein
MIGSQRTRSFKAVRMRMVVEVDWIGVKRKGNGRGVEEEEVGGNWEKGWGGGSVRTAVG